MKHTTRPFNVVNYLTHPHDVAEYLRQVLADQGRLPKKHSKR